MAVEYNKLQNNRSLAAKKDDSFPALLERMKPEIARALPKHLDPDRMARIALTEFRKNPDLAECSMPSILGSIVTLSQLGLEPGVLGQAYLIPYGTTCQGIPGWQGIADLVSRTGRASVWTGAVYDGDEFEYAYGDRPFLTHRPAEDPADNAALRYVYAIGRIKNAEWPIIEVWSVRKIEKHRNRFNKVGKRHYSFASPHNFEMYGRKVALLQVIKYMPKSVELQTAVDLENAAEVGKPTGTLYEGSYMPLDPTPDRDAERSEPAKEAGQEAQQPQQRAQTQQTHQTKKPEAQQPAEAKQAETNAEPQTDAQPEPPRQDAPQAEPEQDAPQDHAVPQLTFSQAFAAVEKAKTDEDFDLIRSQIKHLPERQRTTIDNTIRNKLERLSIEAEQKTQAEAKDEPARKKTPFDLE